MARVFYRFGHDIALRLTSGQAFALKDAEMGAIYAPDATPICCLRGGFTAASYRGLTAQGVLPPDPAMRALNQAVAVQLNLRPELAQQYGRDADTLLQIARRLDHNNLTDEAARNLLRFEVWQLAQIAPLGHPLVSASLRGKGQGVEPDAGTGRNTERDTDAEATLALVGSVADALWEAAAGAGEAAQARPLDEPMALADAIIAFFEDEGWGWEELPGEEGFLRTVFDGQNGSWMCYTRILPELDQVIFYSVCPITLPPVAATKMLGFLNHVNTGLSLGNFEVDFDPILVRFRTSVDVTDVGLTPLQFRNLVFHNLAVMDIYLPEILGVVAGRQ